jgi:hypothetical protein
VVTTSIEKAQEQLKLNSPAIKHAILKNGKEVIIVVDKALKHPMVVGYKVTLWCSSTERTIN